jgi:hypothetical protein
MRLLRAVLGARVRRELTKLEKWFPAAPEPLRVDGRRCGKVRGPPLRVEAKHWDSWPVPVAIGSARLTHSITSDTVYPPYQSPLLYFGGGTKVDGSSTTAQVASVIWTLAL